MSVQEDVQWDSKKPEWQNPENFIIFWGFERPKIPHDRKALFGIRYLESVADPKGLIPVQQKCLNGFLEWSKLPEVVFTSTPSAAEYLKPHCRKTASLPSGYDPEVMGRPDWSIEKTHDIAVYGHEVGRRKKILAMARKRFKDRIISVKGYGLGRKRLVESARCVLFVGHSEEASFPGMRLWQMVATSSALISERRDSWPADPTRHLIHVDPVDMRMVQDFLDDVEKALKMDLAGVARTAHQELSCYSVERCMEEFVIPATEGLRGA